MNLIMARELLILLPFALFIDLTIIIQPNLSCRSNDDVLKKKKNNNFFVHLVGALLSADGGAFWAQSICTAIERESAILPSFFRK